MKQYLKKNPYVKLIGIMVGAIFLISALVRLIPWQILLLLLFFVLVIFGFLGHLWIDVSNEQAKAKKITPVYRPPASSSPRVSQARPKRQKSSPSGVAFGREKPKSGQIPDYEQPQAHYPEQPPPMMMM